MAGGDRARRVRALRARRSGRRLSLPPRFLNQMTHLTCPATIWRYVEGAVTRAPASLVMLDLEDSIPRGDTEALERGREQVIRALNELDWGSKLRFFRPRGFELDPEFTDLFEVVSHAGARLEGVIYPKVDSAAEAALVDEALSEAESEAQLEPGRIRLEFLIESIEAEGNLEEIAHATPRLSGLILGAFDYWSTLGLSPEEYHPGHPLLQDLRIRLVKEAARAGVPAIAEMTVNYPTRDKPESERRAALEACRRDAELAKQYGFLGKWVGIPAQIEVVHEVFRLAASEVALAVERVRAYGEAARTGRGAIIHDGEMMDRANDRMNRGVLHRALAQGQLPLEIAEELKIE